MNILFITADQWRGECLSALGHPVVKTPNMDALAKEGVLFKQHYAQATECAPSRTSIHTGMYMCNHRCVDNGTPVDSRLSNWALEMRKIGYDPSLFGYTDSATDPRGLDKNDPRLVNYSEPMAGFGSYTQYKDEVSADWVHSLISKGYEMPEVLWDLHGDTVEGVDWKNGGEALLPLKIKAEDHETHFMVDKCIAWINGQQKKPWVTHLSLLRPHPPFTAPAPYHQFCDPAQQAHPIRSDSASEEGEQHPFLKYHIENTRWGSPESIKKLQQAKAHYYGLMSEVDDNIGRLIDQLKASGEWESTLIILTSDHGEQMGDHWLIGKMGYFDQSYHIPLIIRDPRPNADASRGMQIEAFTENVDIMPTMLDWLGCDIPAQCDGRSLIPILQSGEAPESWRKEVHWEFDFRLVLDDRVERHFGLTAHQCNLTVIRDNRYKYVHFTALPPLFFDLEADPNEFTNLADEAEYQSLVLEYAQKMLSWRMNHTDRSLTEIFITENGPITRRSTLS